MFCANTQRAAAIAQTARRLSFAIFHFGRLCECIAAENAWMRVGALVCAVCSNTYDFYPLLSCHYVMLSSLSFKNEIASRPPDEVGEYFFGSPLRNKSAVYKYVQQTVQRDSERAGATISEAGAGARQRRPFVCVVCVSPTRSCPKQPARSPPLRSSNIVRGADAFAVAVFTGSRA